MGNYFEAINRLPAQLHSWAQTRWARWTGDKEAVAEATYWSLKDLQGSLAASTQPTSTAIQQAFDDAALTARDPRFIGRETALETLVLALSEWREGRACMVSIQGPQGVGISSLLAQVTTLIHDHEVLISERFCQRLRNTTDVLDLFARTLGLSETPASVPELIEILQQTEPRIILLDDAHLLAFRVMGTRTAVRTFGSILVASQPRHLWILGFRRHAWRRLNYLYQAERYFTHTIELDYFSADELKAVISQRFEHARIEIDWSDQHWSRLHQYSRGKPDLAFHYSRLLASENPAEDDRPEVLRPIDLSFLKSLDMEDLFSLAELAVHGSLHCAEHQQIFHETPDGSLMRLEHLCNRGLVERFIPICGETTPRYRITPILSGQIAEHLYKVNYLY
ncbi:MAG: ATP-binding protein [Gammaproteobacteria bacterium]|nr:ATP-binding protein [Gammaproteobacteria bacterium]